MKKMKKMMCILLTAVLCVTSAVSVMGASTKYTKASNAYQSWLKKMTPGKYHQLDYDIVDLDGNGIPELMASGFSKEGAYSYVYTYNAKAGKMVRLRKAELGRAMGTGAGIMYNKARKMFKVYSATTKDSTQWFYKVKGTKITKVSVYEFKIPLPGKVTYLINNKKCSEATYSRRIKNAQKGFQFLRYKTA